MILYKKRTTKGLIRLSPSTVGVLNVILLWLCLFVLGVYFFVVVLTRIVCYSILNDFKINQFVNLFCFTFALRTQ